MGADRLKVQLLVVRENRLAIKLYFPIDHNRKIAALLEKLHDLFSLSCHLRPTRCCFRILLETTELVTFELEIHFAQSGSTGAPDGETAVPQRHALGVVNQCLLPH